MVAGIIALLIVVVLLIFGIILIIPVLSNVQDIAEHGFLCGAFGICLPDTDKQREEAEKENREQMEREQNIRNPEPEDGVWICDLIIEAGGDLDDRPFNLGESFIIEMGAESQTFPEGIYYEWKNCYFKGEPSLNSILPASFLGMFALDFAFVVGDEIFVIDIELKGLEDGRTITSFEEPGLKETIIVDSGLVQLPRAWKTTHLVENIVCQDYELEATFPNNELDANDGFFAGAEIAGTPYNHLIEKPDPQYGVCIDR